MPAAHSEIAAQPLAPATALIGHGLDEHHAHEYEEHVRQGRSLVTFHAYEAAQAGEAKAIFERFGGTDVRSYSTGM